MYIIQTILLWIVLSTAINSFLMSFPIPVFRKKAYPPKYLINKSNRIDFQKHMECAAFSTAYLLRHFGFEADGNVLYTHFPNKTSTGTVYPKGIRKVLKKSGFKTNYFKGNIDTLKYEVSKGTPVIVFIKVEKDRNYLHFVPVVGYDEEFIYLAESMERLANCENGIGYNRKVPISEFIKLWNTKRINMPFYSYTYITVKTQ